MPCSAQQRNIKPNSLHEKIDVTKALTRHFWWKSFALANSLHDSIPEICVSINIEHWGVQHLLDTDN
jgi:hypothetical protein